MELDPAAADHLAAGEGAVVAVIGGVLDVEVVATQLRFMFHAVNNNKKNFLYSIKQNKIEILKCLRNCVRFYNRHKKTKRCECEG